MTTGNSRSRSEKRTLVFFPTYNEAGNVEHLIQGIGEQLPHAHILAVNDASPDGTGELLDRLALENPKLTVVHRTGKLGVGSAHKLAMLHARSAEYDRLITMDADLSHHPRYLPRFPELLEAADFVTGSRYMPGGGCDYGPFRTLISRTANASAKLALGLGLAENTTLYRGFTLDLLRRLDIDSIKSDGYSFAIESVFEVARLTRRMAEFPIHFEHRMAGASKISQREIYKAIWTIQRLALRRLTRFAPFAPFAPLARGPKSEPAPTERVICCACGGTYHVELYPPKSDDSEASIANVSPYSCASHSGRSHGQILKCLTCELVFMRPKLSHEELVHEYADAEDPVYLEHIQARETTFRYNLHRVRGYLREHDRVLEIGSYCGAFLAVAREQGIDVMGLEPCRWAAEASAKITDARVICGTVDDLPADTPPFEVVVAWDVLEHLSNPVHELEKINRLLTPRGTLLLSTLMIDNWFPRLMGKRWPWLMDMHLFYFTESTIRNVLGQAGFKVVDDDKYNHTVTLDYLVSKLGTLGLPGAAAISASIAGASFAKTEIPFRFGDIKLFACQKVSEVGAAAPSRPVLRAAAR